MAFDLEEEEEVEENESYLASYSDLVTDLMAIFVMLFSFAMMATAQQNYAMKQEIEANKNQTQSIVTEAELEAQEDLDMLYETIRNKISGSEYENDIFLERGDNFIIFQFQDNVLFYPDSPVIRTDSHDILQYIGDLLVSVQDSLGIIEITGHTAKVSEDNGTNTVSWKLSSDRAIAVLQFFVDECGLPQDKMSVAGYAHFRPVADNDKEETRSLNRRVEVKINRIDS